jgi:hypothetical protein
MAAITDLTTLKAEVAGWLHRSDLTNEIPGWIQLAQIRIYRDLRIKQMETALSSAITAGVVAVPSGYVEMKYAYIDGSPMAKLQRKDAEWIYQNYPTRSADGKPKFFAREASNFIFGPYPTDGYTLKGVYYKKLADLTTTNWLTDDAPDLILFATLCEAAPWMGKDERIPTWEGATTWRKIASSVKTIRKSSPALPLR